MWYAKMYFSEDREIFQYDSLGTLDRFTAASWRYFSGVYHLR